MSKTRMGQGVARTRRSQRRHRVLTAPCTGAHRLRVLLRSPGARPLHFTFTGGLAGLLQLGLLALLVGRGWPSGPANAVAFLLAAQVNFAVSSLFTWRDRRRTAPLWRRWLAFPRAIAGLGPIKPGGFLAARAALPA